MNLNHQANQIWIKNYVKFPRVTLRDFRFNRLGDNNYLNR